MARGRERAEFKAGWVGALTAAQSHVSLEISDELARALGYEYTDGWRSCALLLGACRPRPRLALLPQPAERSTGE